MYEKCMIAGGGCRLLIRPHSCTASIVRQCKDTPKGPASDNGCAIDVRKDIVLCILAIHGGDHSTVLDADDKGDVV